MLIILINGGVRESFVYEIFKSRQSYLLSCQPPLVML